MTKAERTHMEKIVNLKNAMRAAHEAARKVAETTPDDGTCNLDSCYIKLPRWKEAEVNLCMRESGLRGCKEAHGYFLIFSPFGGQAWLNTAQVEAMNKVFRDFGFESYVNYIID